MKVVMKMNLERACSVLEKIKARSVIDRPALHVTESSTLEMPVDARASATLSSTTTLSHNWFSVAPYLCKMPRISIWSYILLFYGWSLTVLLTMNLIPVTVTVSGISMGRGMDVHSLVIEGIN